MTQKKYSTVNLFFRSLLTFIYGAISVFFYSIICIFSFLFPLRFRHALIRTFLKSYIFVLKKVCLIDYEIEGLENIPKDRIGIVLCKHQSTWETFLLPTLFHDAAIILKRELLWVPFFGWGLKTLDPITINRRDKHTAMQQIIAKGQQCIDSGRWIIVFPEGTRILPGKTGKYHMGGARLAVATKAPVLPIAHNAGTFWPKRKFIKQPGTIKVVVGPLIETQNKSAEVVMDLAKNFIESTMKRIQ